MKRFLHRITILLILLAFQSLLFLNTNSQVVVTTNKNPDLSNEQTTNSNELQPNLLITASTQSPIAPKLTLSNQNQPSNTLINANSIQTNSGSKKLRKQQMQLRKENVS